MKKAITILVVIVLLSVSVLAATHTFGGGVYQPMPPKVKPIKICPSPLPGPVPIPPQPTPTPVVNQFYGGGGGMNRCSIIQLITGNREYCEVYYDAPMWELWVNYFASVDELEKANRRIDTLECKIIYPEASLMELNDCVMQKRADRTCMDHTLNGKVYSPGVAC